jgi:hypothetical protein
MLRVTPEGTAGVVIHPHPPDDDDNVILLPFRQYFTDDGTDSGTVSMKVAGTAAAPIPYWINAQDDRDIYIKTILVEITGAGGLLNEFANLGAALANGVDFYWETQAGGRVTIDDALQTNWDFVRLSGGVPAFGDGNNSFRANNVSGTSEGFIPTFDIAKLFGLPWGFRLRRGTQDRVVFAVQDDLTPVGVTSFNILGLGVSR